MATETEILVEKKKLPEQFGVKKSKTSVSVPVILLHFPTHGLRDETKMSFPIGSDSVAILLLKKNCTSKINCYFNTNTLNLYLS